MSRTLVLLPMLLMAGVLHAQTAPHAKATSPNEQHTPVTVTSSAPQAGPVTPVNATTVVAGKPRRAANGAPACFQNNGQQPLTEAQRCHPTHSAQQ